VKLASGLIQKASTKCLQLHIFFLLIESEIVRTVLTPLFLSLTIIWQVKTFPVVNS
jgi:hypothetical protein